MLTSEEELRVADEPEPEQATAKTAPAAKITKIKRLRTGLLSRLKIYPDE